MRQAFTILRPILAAGLSMLALAADAQPPATPSLEEQVLTYINAARTNPVAYAATLQQYRGYFDADIVRFPGSDVGLRTREGVAAVDEAIAFLAHQRPMPALQPRSELTQAALELVQAQGLEGGGSSAADARTRIKKHGGGGLFAEALSYGASDAAAVVRQLIVDDGVPGRPNRKLLFEPKYKNAGIACGPHPANRSICAIDLASLVGADARAKKKPSHAPVEIDVW